MPCDVFTFVLTFAVLLFQVHFRKEKHVATKLLVVHFIDRVRNFAETDFSNRSFHR